MIILSLSSEIEWGIRLSKYLNSQVVEIYSKTFPNGEVLSRISNPKLIKENDVILYIRTYPDTNNKLFLLFQTLEALNHYMSRSVTLIIPYLSYSRQDKRFLEGESLSLKLLMDILNMLRVDNLITIDVHNEESLRKYAKNIRVYVISLYDQLLQQLLKSFRGRKIDESDIILVAPDKGRLNVVSRLAEKFSLDYIFFEKYRDRYTGRVSINPPSNIPKVNNAIIIDDEIATGGTIASVAKYLYDNGVKNIYALAIHLILVNNATEKLLTSGVKHIVGTNTIINPHAILEVEPYIANTIKEVRLGI